MAVVLTTVGKHWIIDKLQETLSTLPNRIGWGTGAGTSNVSDTALFTEASEARATAVLDQPSADTLRAVGTLTADGNKTVTNAGLFDAASGGVLVVKGDHAGVPLEANDSIEYTFTLQAT